MDLGTIEREIAIDASPETVYEVISSPQHISGYADHVQGWDRFVPGIRDYAEQLVVA